MNKQRNKTGVPQVFVAEHPSAAPVLSPHRPKTTPKSSRQQAKSLSQPEQESKHDIPVPAPVETVEPNRDEIAKRADEIYLEKGCPQGQDDQIWLQAEIELLHKKMSRLSSKLHL